MPKLVYPKSPDRPIDRDAQNQLAQKLYAADPGRAEYGDSECWIAACFTAYDILVGHLDAEQIKIVTDYYGVDVPARA
jgi:predicted nucleic acid-binding protein